MPDNTLTPKTPEPTKDLFKELMKVVIDALNNNLALLKQSKRSVEDKEENDLFLEKMMNQQKLAALKQTADKEFSKNGVMAQFLEETTMAQLKVVADEAIKTMQGTLAGKNQQDQKQKETQTAQAEQQKQQLPQPKPGQTDAKEKEEEKKKQEEEEREKEEKKKREKEEEEEKKKRNKGEKKGGNTSSEMKSGGLEEIKDSKDNKKDEVKEIDGQRTKDGMTEGQTIDAGKELGGVLKNPKFQEKMGMSDNKNSNELDELGGKADNMKSAQADKNMAPSPFK